MTEASDPPVGGADPAPVAGPRSASPVTRVAMGVIAALFLTTILFAGLAVGYKGDLDERRAVEAERLAVADVSGRLVLALLDFGVPAADQEAAVLALAGGDFAAEFESAFPGVREAYEALDAVSEATIVDVFVGHLDEGATSASAVVVFDQSLDSPLGPRTLEDSYFRLELVKEGEAWRVHQLRSVAGAGGAGLPVPEQPLSSPTPEAPEEPP